IFSLPIHFGQLPHPLAYVEWFTHHTGMHLIKRSTCTHHWNTKIISAARIVQGCHL
ncbi:hypothetical protein L208DRAFT_1188064, partial [Tricholoma matsutake]